MTLTDLRHAVRGLRRAPAFSSMAVLTLGLAIGANTAIYSALRPLVLNPMPFAGGDRMVYLWHTNPQMSGVMLTPPLAAIDRWRESSVFEAMEAYTGSSAVMTGAGEPVEVNVTALAPTALGFLGVAPMMGRGITEADAASGAPDVALISHALWQSRYGGAPDIVGRTLMLSDRAHTIVGVMPPRFVLPMGSDTAWTAARPATNRRDSRNVLARLKPGVTTDEARGALAAIDAAATDPDLKGWSAQVMSPADYNGSSIQTTLWVLSGSVGLLLLLACANIANLMLARNGGRLREMALRHSLGAARGRLLGFLAAESLTVATAGGVVGLLLAQWLTTAMSSLRPDNLVILERMHIDGAAVLFAVAATLITAVLFGLAPALSASRVDLQHVIQRADRGRTPAGHRVRLALTSAQIAIALILLVGASLLVRSFLRLTAVDAGFNPDGLIAIRVSLPNDRYGDRDPEVARAKRQQFFDAWLEAARATPGVTAAAIGNGLPPALGIMIGRLAIEGREPATPSGAQSVFSGGYISPDYFDTLGIPLLEGRRFTPADAPGTEGVAIISEAVADRYFPAGDALGARLRLQTGGWNRVVGIVGGVRANSLMDTEQQQVYFPRAQLRPAFGVLIVRTTLAPAGVIDALKARTWDLDPKLPLRDIFTADTGLARARSQQRFTLTLITAFAVSGLLVAAIGVYGVMALYVGQRRREVGIRVALGATRREVIALVLRQTGSAMAAGVIAGGIGAVLARQWISALLYDTAPGDPTSFSAAVGVVVAAGLSASYLPIRQATSVDPAAVLRGE